MTGVDVTQSEGIEETTALMVISEIGLDMSRWPSEKHCTSWLGVCPHQQVSGGTVLSSRTRPTTHRAAAALRLAVASLHHSKSALGAYVRRMQSRLGPPKALTATATSSPGSLTACASMAPRMWHKGSQHTSNRIATAR